MNGCCHHYYKSLARSAAFTVAMVTPSKVRQFVGLLCLFFKITITSFYFFFIDALNGTDFPSLKMNLSNKHNRIDHMQMVRRIIGKGVV